MVGLLPCPAQLCLDPLWVALGEMQNFVHSNTDGQDNPYTKVPSVAGIRRDFPSFRVVRAHKEFIHAPPLPVARLGLASVAGWHPWVHIQPVSTPVTRARRTRSIRRPRHRQHAGRTA